MPLKERGGELLREFININYKLINSHAENEYNISLSETSWSGFSIHLEQY